MGQYDQERLSGEQVAQVKVGVEIWVGFSQIRADGS